MDEGTAFEIATMVGAIIRLSQLTQTMHREELVEVLRYLREVEVHLKTIENELEENVRYIDQQRSIA